MLQHLPNQCVVEAAWSWTGSQAPPQQGLQVRVEQGQVVEVGRGLSRTALELGNCVLLPGLINPHCHLEFSLLERPLGEPGMGFAQWVRQVVRWRQSLPAGPTPDAWHKGAQELLQNGTAWVGEVLAAPVDMIPQVAWPRLAVFGELLGLVPERAERALAQAEKFVRHALRDFGPHWGLAPHAPYTVHPRLLAWAVDQSRRHRRPVQFHLAESPEEMQLLAQGTGSLVEVLQELGAWNPNVFSPGVRPRDFLHLLRKAHRVLVIHGNYLNAEDWAYLARWRNKFSLVYCPSTHAYFGHRPYPLWELLQQGVRVVLGTDSRASAPQLNLLQEARLAAQAHPSVAPQELLGAITHQAARALGLGSSWGRIRPGAAAVFAAVRFSPGDLPSKPEEVLQGVLMGSVEQVELWLPEGSSSRL